MKTVEYQQWEVARWQTSWISECGFDGNGDPSWNILDRSLWRKMSLSSSDSHPNEVHIGVCTSTQKKLDQLKNAIK